MLEILSMMIGKISGSDIRILASSMQFGADNSYTICSFTWFFRSKVKQVGLAVLTARVKVGSGGLQLGSAGFRWV